MFKNTDISEIISDKWLMCASLSAGFTVYLHILREMKRKHGMYVVAKGNLSRGAASTSLLYIYGSKIKGDSYRKVA
jgi:hypothetical protein